MQFRIHASGSSGNLYSVEDGQARLLIEAGLPVQEIRKKLLISGLEGCLLTHEHKDHAKGAPALMLRGIDVYCSEGTARALDLKGHRLHIVKHREQFNVGPFLVMPFTTEHDAAEPLGFIVKGPGGKLLFATDTQFLRWQFQGLTHIAIEANWDEDEPLEAWERERLTATHMSIQAVERFFKAQDIDSLSAIYLLHLSGRNANSQQFIERIQALTGVPVRAA